MFVREKGVLSTRDRHILLHRRRPREVLGAGLAPSRFCVKTLAVTRTTDQECSERMGQASEEGPAPMPTTSCPSALVSPGRHAGLR